MRPPGPVPLTRSTSMLCSATKRRTTGDSRRLSDCSSAPSAGAAPSEPASCCSAAGAGAGAAAGAGGAGAGAVGGGGTSAAGAGAGAVSAGAASGCGSGAAGGAASAGAGAGAGDAAPCGSPTTAITAPTGTVSPSWARISLTVPAIGDGTSVSTLSVLTSNSGSSADTLSPTFLNHRVLVPSVTVSPSCGNVTSAMCGLSPIESGVEAAAREGQYGFSEEFGEAGVRLDEFGDLGRGGLPVDREVPTAELFGDPGADHVHAQYLTGGAVGLLLGDDLDEPVELTEYLRPAVGPELMLGDHDVMAGRARRLFARAREGDLWMAVDRPWHTVVGDR